MVEQVLHTWESWKIKSKMYCQLREVYSLNPKKYFSLKNSIIKDGMEREFRSIFNGIEKKGKLVKGRILAQYSMPTFLKNR